MSITNPLVALWAAVASLGGAVLVAKYGSLTIAGVVAVPAAAIIAGLIVVAVGVLAQLVASGLGVTSGSVTEVTDR